MAEIDDFGLLITIQSCIKAHVQIRTLKKIFSDCVVDSRANIRLCYVISCLLLVVIKKSKSTIILILYSLKSIRIDVIAYAILVLALILFNPQGVYHPDSIQNIISHILIENKPT